MHTSRISASAAWQALISSQEFGVEAEYNWKYIVRKTIRKQTEPSRGRSRLDCSLSLEVEREYSRSPHEAQIRNRSIAMDEKSDLSLELRIGSRLEVERNLPNNVVEIPWKREFDSIAAHRSDIGPFVSDRASTCSRSVGLGLGRIYVSRRSVACLWRSSRLRLNRCRADRWLANRRRLWKGHFLDRGRGCAGLGNGGNRS